MNEEIAVRCLNCEPMLARRAAALAQRTLPQMAPAMDLQLKSAKERAAYYEQEAEKFRRIAEAEPVAHIRNELRALAAQYRRLAESLDARRRATN